MVMETNPLALPDDKAALDEIKAVIDRVNTEAPAKSDVRALRRLLVRYPGLWRFAGDLAHNAMTEVLSNVIENALLRESVRRGWDELRDELGYQIAPPLERLLIDQVALCWIRLFVCEWQYTDKAHRSIPLSQADYWERRLSAAQRRFLRAIETLARVRRIVRKTLVQVNIAEQGGQQVNLLADAQR